MMWAEKSGRRGSSYLICDRGVTGQRRKGEINCKSVHVVMDRYVIIKYDDD